MAQTGDMGYVRTREAGSVDQATHRLRTASDLLALRQWLRGMLAGHTDGASTADVVMATQEAVTNSLRAHGKGSRPVEVRLHVDDEYLWVEVEDRGSGFAAGNTWRQVPSLDLDHGRGLYLMKALMDVLEISSYRAGSRVRMGKRLAG
jgi:serine/threonine-protein kinase RsbW